MPRFLNRRAEQRSANLGSPGMLVATASPSLAGVYVTPQTALTFTAIFAGIRVLAEDSASLPLDVYQRQTDGSRVLQEKHPAHELLSVSPDGETTDMQFREAWLAHALLWGNGYCEIEWSKGGEPLGLHLLHPGATKPKRDGRGKLYYDLIDQGTQLTPDRVVHLAGIGFNGLQGYCVAALAAEAIGLGKAEEEFQAAFYGNGATAGGFLEYPGKLSDAARENLRQSFGRQHSGSRNAHKFALLEEGLKYNQTMVSPEHAQLVESRKFQVEEIARILRVPPHKIGDFSQAHLANIEASNLDYLISALRPWLIRVEKALNFKLLTRQERQAGFYVRHDMRALLRADARTRAEYYTRLRDLGVLTPDDILDLEDMNPIGDAAGGNKRLVPLNMTTLEQAGKTPDPASSKRFALVEVKE